MGITQVWHKLRGKAHIIFPIVSLVLTALILASPFMGGPLAFMHQMEFMRFCMFWCLAVCIVLATCGSPRRPSLVATVSTLISVAVTVVLYLVYGSVLGQPSGVGPFFFSCLSGSILGALAGTWFIYVLEVYVGGRK